MKILYLTPDVGEDIRDFAVRMLQLSDDKNAVVRGLHQGRKIRAFPSMTIDMMIDE